MPNACTFASFANMHLYIRVSQIFANVVSQVFASFGMVAQIDFHVVQISQRVVVFRADRQFLKVLQGFAIQVSQGFTRAGHG